MGPHPPSGGETGRRRYSSERRQRQAAQTRAEILSAAVSLFAERGWAGTTVAAVAERAEVAVETIYSGFRSKKGLLRAAMDVAVVGDAEEVPFVERPEIARLGEGDLDQRLRAMAALATDIHERSIGVWRAILEAAGADPEVDRWRAELEAGRRVDVGRALERVVERAVPSDVVDAVWVLLAPEAYLKLTVDAGRSRRRYERLLVDAVRRQLT